MLKAWLAAAEEVICILDKKMLASCYAKAYRYDMVYAGTSDTSHTLCAIRHIDAVAYFSSPRRFHKPLPMLRHAMPRFFAAGCYHGHAAMLCRRRAAPAIRRRAIYADAS